MYDLLGKAIDALDFDTVFRIVDGEVVTTDEFSAPAVYNVSRGDIDIDARENWSAFTGMTGQYGYNGAVMHRSEFIGAAIARRLDEYSTNCRDNGDDVVFAIVLVYDFKDSESIGWAICHYEIVS